MKVKFVRQQNEKDCAVACLYNIVRYYGGYINMDKLRSMLKTNKNGTSVYDIVKVSNEIHLLSDAYKCELNDLCSQDFPIMAHIKIQGKYEHFVILKKIIDDEIFIFDPIRGHLKLELEEFEKE